MPELLALVKGRFNATDRADVARRQKNGGDAIRVIGQRNAVKNHAPHHAGHVKEVAFERVRRACRQLVHEPLPGLLSEGHQKSRQGFTQHLRRLVGPEECQGGVVGGENLALGCHSHEAGRLFFDDPPKVVGFEFFV